MDSISQRLNLHKVPRLVGRTAKQKLKQYFAVLTATKWPLYITGPSGSGKSVIAMNLAKEYAEVNDVPAYYVQISQEMTKTSLILGLRLVNGSLEVVDGVVAKCMQEGGVIIVDEATHGTQDILLTFNSILDSTSVTAVGDRIIYAKDTFRVIFCSNDSSYAGNVRLPQSFAQRVVAFYLGYPEWIDEARVIKRIATKECSEEITVPSCVIKYIASYIRENRTNEFPLSARNGAIATVLMNLEHIDAYEEHEIDASLTSGPTVEAKRRSIAKRIYNKEVTDVALLTTGEVTKFMHYVSAIGISRFTEVMLSACMYYLDVDGVELEETSIRNRLRGSVI